MSKIKLSIVFALLFLISCGGHVTTPAPSSQSVRFLALGDSYTIGKSVVENERWPNQLAAMLSNKNIQTDVTIIARTGWTTSELWQGIQANPPQGKYDLVSLLIGVNNQYRGYDLDTYRDEFRFLLEKTIEYAGGKPEHVILLSIPDWGVTPFASGRDRDKIANDIDAFNLINLDESKKMGVHYVDVTLASREALKDPGLVAGDGLHPSAKMYAEWAKLVLPIAIRILE
ncbi:MAG: SGNH/GDSL hydrolase family protein [Chloroflexi bacterium]|nr:SGNH/GDSL hydrolase family protein [Chloroflexota bacterium]